jgi:hypothetical protein
MWSLRVGIPMYVVFFSAGCATLSPTQPVPYSTVGRAVDSHRTWRIEEPLTIHMSDELQRLTVTVKPLNIPGAMAYRFHVGESIRSNLITTLEPLYGSVRVSNDPVAEGVIPGESLNVELTRYDFQVPTSIFGTHVVNLVVRYDLHRAGSVVTVETSTSGTSREQPEMGFSLEDLTRFAVLHSSPTAGGFVMDMANAYGTALARSIDTMLVALGEHVPRARVK